MMSQFYFVLTNPEAESLLKLEVKTFYHSLNLSYSRPGFLTFKGDKSQLFKPLFARVYGICLGKVPLEDLKYSKAWVWKRDESFTIPPELQKLSDSSLFKIGEKVTLIMMVGENEFWVGEYTLLSTHFQTPGEVSSIQQKIVPSRAYYKIAEAFEAFDLPFEHQANVLELGSAPGGASLFLLDQDMKVFGVDPAEMDPAVLKNYNFKHIKKPFETINEGNFKEDIDWIISDVNLPPTVVIKEVSRLLDFLGPRGLVLTLKINEDKHIRFIKASAQKFRELGYNKVELKYLPSHRREIALIALHS